VGGKSRAAIPVGVVFYFTKDPDIRADKADEDNNLIYRRATLPFLSSRKHFEFRLHFSSSLDVQGYDSLPGYLGINEPSDSHTMSSGFVSGGTTDNPIERDDDWLKAQEEIETNRRQREEESKQDGGKTLYEVLQNNKGDKPSSLLSV